MPRSILAPLLDVLFPPTCLICGVLCDVNADSHAICANCFTQTTTDPFQYCPRCASNAGAFADEDIGCPRCRVDTFRYDRVMRLGPYDGLLRDAILKLKEATGEPLAEVLGMMFAQQKQVSFNLLSAQVVVPIPLHWRKRLARGYNQSAAIAWGFAKGLNLPIKNWLKRTKMTADQTAVSATARRDNLKGAFMVVKQANLKGLHVLVVDDVLTTGSTCSEAAGALKLAGAAQVTAVVLAHRS